MFPKLSNILKFRCHGNEISWLLVMKKILRIKLIPQFLTNAHEIWHTLRSRNEDVQDTFFNVLETALPWTRDKMAIN